MVDDLHAADGSSLRVLDALTNEVAGCQMLVVGTLRTAPPGSTLERWSVSTLRRPCVRELAVTALTVDAVTTYAQLRLRSHVGPSAGARIHSQTGGNPVNYLTADSFTASNAAEVSLRRPGGGRASPGGARYGVTPRPRRQRRHCIPLRPWAWHPHPISYVGLGAGTPQRRSPVPSVVAWRNFSLVVPTIAGTRHQPLHVTGVFIDGRVRRPATSALRTGVELPGSSGGVPNGWYQRGEEF